MKILVGCEFSQVLTRAFRARGHEAYSCDILPTKGNPEWHLTCDVLDVLDRDWDLGVFFPPCTYLCSSGLHWNVRRPERKTLTEEAFEFVMKLANAPIGRICIENPIGCLSTRWRKPDQIISPYQYGHDESKKTCLWLKNLPRLTPTCYVEPKMSVLGKKVWGNQTPSGQNRLGPSPDRGMLRSVTYEGVARAMINAWSELEKN